MTPEQRAAFVNAAVARAMIRALGMHAENMYRGRKGEAVAYREDAFVALIDEEGIGRDSVLMLLEDSRSGY